MVLRREKRGCISLSRQIYTHIQSPATNPTRRPSCPQQHATQRWIGRAYILSIRTAFRSNLPGSSTTNMKNRTCTTSNLSTRSAGTTSCNASTARIVTFAGSQGGGGHCEMSMPRPSRWAVGGSWRARSRSQVLDMWAGGKLRIGG